MRETSRDYPRLCASGKRRLWWVCNVSWIISWKHKKSSAFDFRMAHQVASVYTMHHSCLHSDRDKFPTNVRSHKSTLVFDMKKLAKLLFWFTINFWVQLGSCCIENKTVNGRQQRSECVRNELIFASAQFRHKWLFVKSRNVSPRIIVMQSKYEISVLGQVFTSIRIIRWDFSILKANRVIR